MSTTIPDHSLDGQSKSELMIGLSAAFTFVCVVVVSARIYTRAIMLRTFGIDDVFIVITQVRSHPTTSVSYAANVNKAINAS